MRRPNKRSWGLFTLVLVLAAAVTGGSTAGHAAPLGKKPVKKKHTLIKLVGLYDVSGEDSTASAEEDNAVKLAIATLARSGIKVSVDRVARGADPTTAQTGLVKGLAEKPAAMFGLDTTSALAPLLPQIQSNGIPFIAIQTDVVSLAKLQFPNNIFSIRVPAAGGSAATTKYLLDRFGPSSVGLICVSTDFGNSACAADRRVLDANHVKITNQVQSPVTSTDESAQASAMLGSDLVFDEGFPSPIVLDIKAMSSQGLNVPVSAGASARFVARSNSLTSSQLSRLFGFEDCTFDAGDALTGFAAAYNAKYQSLPTYLAAETYDTVMMLGKTIDRVGTSRAKINAALRKLKYTGACSTYNGSGRYQMLNTQANIIGFTGSGSARIIKRVTVDLGTVG